MSQNEKSVNDEVKGRRSPISPMLPIDDAIERVRQIYAQDRRAFTDFKTLAGHLGYKVEKRGGRSGRTISTLKQYGLLDERAGQYRVSDTAWKILEMPQESEERARLVKDAALSPPIIRKILAHYNGELPSDATLRSHLLFNEGFNADNATDFIRVLRRTIELVSPLREDYNAGEESDGGVLPPTGGKPMQQQPPSGGGRMQPPMPSAFTPPAPQHAPLAPGESELKFNISRDSQARVVFSGQVTQEAIIKLAALLDLSKDTFPTQAELVQPRQATWRNQDHDQPVKVIGEAGVHDGRKYVKVEGSDTAVPEDEIEYSERL